MLTDSGHSHWQINEPLSQPFSNLWLASSAVYHQEIAGSLDGFLEQWKKGSL